MILYLGTDPSHYKERKSLIHYPIIKLIPRDIPPDIFEEIPRYTHCIFTSKNTVSILKDAFVQKGLSFDLLQNKSIIALGQITAAQVRKEGLQVAAIAEEETQEGVMSLLQQMSLGQAYIFLPHSSLSRKNLENFLKENHIQHRVCDLYDTVVQKLEPVPNFDEIEEIVFTSPSTVRAFFDIFGIPPSGKKLSCIGSVTQEILNRMIDQKAKEEIS